MDKVKVETTPNPATMKFVFPRTLSDKSAHFSSPQEAEDSPLALKIFGFPWTVGVYLSGDFISITKADWVDWQILSQPLRQLVEEHLEQGLALWSNPKIDTEEAYSADDLTSTDSPLVREIKRALIREIRPIVALDGGDVAFGKFENSILYVHMRGSCAGCPSSKVTLKSGIEVRMRQLFPEISEVVSL